MLYAGYRVIETGAAPGEFFSFITAFLLAYEPAKRLARLNIDLNSQLVGVQMLFDVIDAPASRAGRRCTSPRSRSSEAQRRVARRRFLLPPDEPVLRGLSFVAEPGSMHRAGRPLGRRQIDHPQSAAALLRAAARRDR